MKVTLPPVSFGVGRPVREEMVEEINKALDKDVQYEMPKNYMRGEGDSEFVAPFLHGPNLWRQTDRGKGGERE